MIPEKPTGDAAGNAPETFDELSEQMQHDLNDLDEQVKAMERKLGEADVKSEALRKSLSGGLAAKPAGDETSSTDPAKESLSE